MSRPLFADDCQGYNSSISLIICFVVVLLLLIPPIVGVCNLSMFCCKLLYAHSSFANILMGKRERAVFFALFVFLASRDCCVALPRSAVGFSAVCDCGIS